MPVTRNYPPFYGSSTPYTQPADSPTTAPIIPRGAGDWSQTTYALGGLGGLGQAGGIGRDLLYTLATVGGAAVGGGLVGFVAAKRDWRVAKRGAIFSSGLTALANGFGSFKGGSPLVGSVAVLGGLGALWWTLKDL